MQALQQQLLDRLAGQASAKRSTQRAALEVAALRRQTAAAERQAEASRDALASLRQEIAETEVRCVSNDSSPRFCRVSYTQGRLTDDIGYCQKLLNCMHAAV